MSIKLRTKPLQYNRDITNQRVIKLIEDADQVIIGGGAGLSAAAGLDYSNELFFKKYYNLFYKKGYKSVNEAIGDYWHLTEESKNKYWGFWSNHIKAIFYNQDQLKVYKDLYDIIKNKEYCVITTNVDDQFHKGGFDHDRIYSMQGSYGKFQCQNKCHDTLYCNKEYIEEMLLNVDEDTLEVDSSVIPKCPKCGGLLSPNLRIDHNHVASNADKQRQEYIKHINLSSEKTVYLELGVGYNTPIIIRYPFEEMAEYFDATLIRINLDYAGTTHPLGEKAILINEDISKVLAQLIEV